MPKVLIADAMSPRAAEIFAARGIDVDTRTGHGEAGLVRIAGDYDGMVVRSATKVTARVLSADGRLKVVGRAGIGVDNIDVAAATQAGVVVMNTPYGNAITTAEHTIAMMFAVARQIPAADTSTRAGKWEKARFIGAELHGKTLGLVGCGTIGSIVAERAQGLKMRVIAYDPYLGPARADDLGVEKVGLDTLFARADFITLHAPLTDETRHLIDAAALAKMKPEVRIINCARGGLIVEQDLLSALQAGKVAGAALDVFEQEPATDNSLFALDRVVCTPHLGASTTEAQDNVALQVAEQMSDFLLTGAVVNAINMPAVSAEEAPKLKSYMVLAEQLGSFAGQLTRSGIKSVSIAYEGDAAKLNTKPVSAAILKGLLQLQLESVNMVNAPVAANERGIDVAETRYERPCDYQSLISLTVTTERQTRSVAGTLFGGDKPRVVNVKGIALEAELSQHMIYVTNKDKPGLIGGVGTILGDAGVNIASFHLGRSAEGGDAIALIEVDQKIPGEVLESIANLPNVLQVRPLHF